MFQSTIADTLCSDSTQGEGEQEFVFLPVNSTCDDVPVDVIKGKPPTLAGVVVQKAHVVFAKGFRQFVIPRRYLELPTLFKGPVY